MEVAGAWRPLRDYFCEDIGHSKDQMTLRMNSRHAEECPEQVTVVWGPHPSLCGALGGLAHILECGEEKGTSEISLMSLGRPWQCVSLKTVDLWEKPGSSADTNPWTPAEVQMPWSLSPCPNACRCCVPGLEEAGQRQGSPVWACAPSCAVFPSTAQQR